jgi:hypothetical protein
MTTPINAFKDTDPIQQGQRELFDDGDEKLSDKLKEETIGMTEESTEITALRTSEQQEKASRWVSEEESATFSPRLSCAKKIYRKD